MGTLPAAPRGRTRGHAPGWHHGRLAHRARYRRARRAVGGRGGHATAMRPARAGITGVRPHRARYRWAPRAGNGTGGYTAAGHDGPWLGRLQRDGWAPLRARPAPCATDKRHRTAQRWASAARRRRDQETWQHTTTLKSRAEVDGCARSVGCTPVLGGRVNGTRRVWLADRTSGHAPAAHNGRSASARTVPPSTTRRDWYRRAHVGYTSGTRGHNGRSAPAGTHQPGTTGQSWYRRARANHRHNGLWLARRVACGVVKVTAEAGHRRVNPGQPYGRCRPTVGVSRAAPS